MSEIITEQTLELARRTKEELPIDDLPPVITAYRGGREIATLLFAHTEQDVRDALTHILVTISPMLAADEVMLLLDMRTALIDYDEEGHPFEVGTGKAIHPGDDVERDQEALGVVVCKRDVGLDVALLPYVTIGGEVLWQTELEDRRQFRDTSTFKSSPVADLMRKGMELETTDEIVDFTGMDPEQARLAGDAFSLALLMRRHPVFYLLLKKYGDERDEIMQQGFQYAVDRLGTDPRLVDPRSISPN